MCTFKINLSSSFRTWTVSSISLFLIIWYWKTRYFRCFSSILNQYNVSYNTKLMSRDHHRNGDKWWYISFHNWSSYFFNIHSCASNADKYKCFVRFILKVSVSKRIFCWKNPSNSCTGKGLRLMTDVVGYCRRYFIMLVKMKSVMWQP
jgi:hypothetical protein